LHQSPKSDEKNCIIILKLQSPREESQCLQLQELRRMDQLQARSHDGCSRSSAGERTGVVRLSRNRCRPQSRWQHLAGFGDALAAVRALCRRLGWSSGRAKRPILFSSLNVPAPICLGRNSPIATRCAGAGGGVVDSGAGHEHGASAGHSLRQFRRPCDLHAGGAACRRPAAPVSPAYSLVSKDFDKLKSMIALLDPGAIYVSSAKMFASC
jgi:hypothetical protein